MIPGRLIYEGSRHFRLEGSQHGRPAVQVDQRDEGLAIQVHNSVIICLLNTTRNTIPPLLDIFGEIHFDRSYNELYVNQVVRFGRRGWHLFVLHFQVQDVSW